MPKLSRKFALFAALAIATPLAVPAIAQIRAVTVTFPKGATGTSVKGTIKGDQITDYVVRASAGQTMKVTLSGSSIVYFNVLPPGSNDAAIFVGSTSGNSYTGTLPQTGAYKIRVYQMRATARRGEAGAFTLAVSVTGRASGGGSGIHGSPGASGGKGSIAGVQGMDGIKAFDVLIGRGFKNVDSFSSGDTLYGIYYYAPTRLCVQTTSADGKIVDIRDIKTHPKCR